MRFLYVRPLAAHLGVIPPRDTIERPIVDGLDLGGWDVHKALGLLVRSNAAVLEWLASPITDRRDERTVAGLVGVARLVAHRPALECHHDRLARGAWPPADGESAGFKALFYALRPALALVWLRRVGAPLPMDLPSLMGGLAPRPELVQAVAAPRAREATGSEADPAPRCPEVEAFVSEVLADRPGRPVSWDKAPAIAAA